MLRKSGYYLTAIKYYLKYLIAKIKK
ncbi:hypothetical protein [Megamonas funiformis]